MTSIARKLVSGRKARFKDNELNVDLDLVYLTDRVIIMGYPATGIAAMYRNSREDARKFIEHRHQDKYWIFNFCPLSENAYDPAFFRGHVSRYPFPDHHAPPLALLALAVREMHSWLSGDPDRVIVVHCKAGKGRSGTLACAYLLSLETPPTGPTLQRSVTNKEWASRRAEQLLAQAEEELEDEDEPEVTNSEAQSLKPVDKDEVPDIGGESPQQGGEASPVVLQRTDTPGSMKYVEKLPPPTPAREEIPQSASPSLESVLLHHTQRRMKPRKKGRRTEDGQSQSIKPKYGISISSQRRFLQYWALLISHTFPPRFWSIPPVPQHVVLLKSMTIRLKRGARAGRTTISLLSAAINRFSAQKPAGEVWASISHYDPRFEEKLEALERETRDVEKGVGRSKYGGNLKEELEQGEWDKRKMIRSFGRVGSASPVEEKDGVITHILHPIPREQWMKVNIAKSGKPTQPSTPAEERHTPHTMGEDEASHEEDDESVEVASMASTISSQPGVYSHRSISMDECRAVRVKLFHGQIPMGWFWFIPAFEMMHACDGVYHYKLERSELDFALGAGAWILDVDVEMQWS